MFIFKTLNNKSFLVFLAIVCAAFALAVRDKNMKFSAK